MAAKKKKSTKPKVIKAPLGYQNYRFNFHDPKLKVKYPDDFDKCDRYFECLAEIYKKVNMYTRYAEDSHGLELLAWHHFEPYVEFTMVLPPKFEYTEVLLIGIEQVIADYGFEITEKLTPDNGFFADWYITSSAEAEFTLKSMDLTAKLAMEFWKGEKAIKAGKGKDRMLMRRFHILANQVAYSYIDEARVLNLRGMFAAIASTGVEQPRAVELYEKVTKTKY